MENEEKSVSPIPLTLHLKPNTTKLWNLYCRIIDIGRISE
jgi:hypothetical protein